MKKNKTGRGLANMGENEVAVIEWSGKVSLRKRLWGQALKGRGRVLQTKEEPGKRPEDRQPLARWGPGKEVVGRCGEDHGGHLKALASLGVRLGAVGRW